MKLDAEALTRLLCELRRTMPAAADPVEPLVGLVFLKYLADQDGPTARWHVPACAAWASLLSAGRGYGDALNQAIEALCQTNPELQDVLFGLDFNRVAEGEEVHRRDDALLPLLRQLDRVSLTEGLVSSDTLGDAVSRFLEEAAVDARLDHNAHTPLALARLMAVLLEPAAGMSICDPVSGVGATLAMVATIAARRAGCLRRTMDLDLCGQERSPRAARLCRMNLLLHGMSAASEVTIATGDVLQHPKLVRSAASGVREHDALRRFDRVVAHPPYSLPGWGAAQAAHDRFSRYSFGVPHADQGDFAFIQHCYASLHPLGGRAVLLVLPGVLYRGGEEGRIRQRMLEADAIAAVIRLRPKLLHGTPSESLLLVLERGKPPARRGTVLLIDAEQEMLDAKDPQTLAEVSAHILGCYQSWREEPGFSVVASMDDLAPTEYDLQPHRYIKKPLPAQRRLDAMRQELPRLQERRERAYAQMDALLAALDGPQHGVQR